MIRARAATILAAWLALLLAAHAPPAAAQTVSVRSGAHDGFDRLVFDMPGRRPWRVVPRADGASVIFDGNGPRFDFGAVFERIDRQRLRAISAPDGGGQVDLVFDCDCRIAPFWHAGDMLVIDIADSPPAADPAAADPAAADPAAADPAAAPPAADPVVDTPPAVDPVATPPAADAVAAPPAATPPAPPAPPAADGAGLRRPSTAGAALATRLDGRSGPPIAALPEVPDTPPVDGFDAMRSVLGQQLGRAVNQGLVTPATDRQGRDPGPPVPPPAPPGAPPPAGAGIAAGRSTVPGLRITTSMDRDANGPPRADRAAKTCPPTAHLDVPAWGGTRPFALELGHLNGTLFGEFDTVQEANALRLARLYIHFGFGTEARQVLGWLDPGAPEVARAHDLSRLVEGAPLAAGAALAGALGCGEPGVLWAILAGPDLPEGAVFDHRALRRSFVALPVGLRRAFGPALVQRLLDAGHRETADAILRHLRGGDAPSDAETGLARAARAVERGEDAAAEAALRAVTRSNSEQTGIALAETIERALARAAPVDFDDAQLAGALAFEHRGTPLGGRLAQAYVSALAASGAFAEAMSEFERLRRSLEDVEAARVASVLVVYLVRQADDVTFLRAITGDRIAAPGSLDAPAALGAARRLLALGFPGQAARHVARGQGVWPGAEGAARREVRARIALMQARPAAALRELLSLDGEALDLLRAEALVARGDHGTARRLFAARGADRRADRAALHTHRAAAMAQAEDPSLRALGDILMRDAAAPAAAGVAGVADLSAHRALLERSTALRGAMARLLATTPAQAVTQ
ncbi:hypothetical protein [Roseovarius ramblicola]|uniref:Uncharacterized protein n=1 Tax=Roseovarius ramblicola TaxID=2022336 RepID=A0ABV5HWA3_9RHOB